MASWAMRFYSSYVLEKARAASVLQRSYTLLAGLVMLSLVSSMAISAAQAPHAPDQPNQIALATAPLTITTATGATHRFDIRLATTAAQQAKGLMYVRHMPPDEGMLFVFSAAREAGFWMRNTLIPLDMIFVSVGGRIEKIVTRYDTQSDAVSLSDGRVSAVLELNAGRAAALSLQKGDQLSHPEVAF